MYSDNTRKLAVVMNSKHPTPQLLNGAFHAILGLTSLVGERAFEFLNYDNDELSIKAQISRFPNIVLTAKNGSQIMRTYEAALEAGIACNLFTGSMLAASAEEQIRQTREATAETVDPMVVAMFADSDALQPLTKRYSLFKG